MTIIGATLGAILGLAAILIIILLLLGWKRRRNKPWKQDRNHANDKDRLSFQDQGMEPLTRSVQPMGRGPVPSTDSWALVTNEAGDNLPKPPGTALAAAGTEKGRSPLRNVEVTRPNGPDPALANNANKPVEENDVSGDRLTDEGWGKYFQGDNRSAPLENPSQRMTMSSQATKSDYRGSGWPHASAEVPPLNVAVGRMGDAQPLGQVSSGSPSTEVAPQFGQALVAERGMTAKISSGDSISIASDDYEDDKVDDYSRVQSRIREEPHMSAFGSNFRDERVASSTYSASIHQPFNDGPPFGAAFGGPSDRPLTQWPSDAPPSRQPNQRDSRGPLSSDISWLNLGKNK